MEGNYWKLDLFRTHFHAESGFDNMMDSVMELREPDEVLAIVSRLKETGNGFFRQRVWSCC